MKKFSPVCRTAAVLLASAAAVVLIQIAVINNTVRAYLACRLSRGLNSAVTIHSVRVNPFRGRLSFRDFTLAQPPGFGAGPAFRVERGFLRVNIISLLSSRLVFEEIGLEGVEIRLVRNPAGKFNTGIFFPSSPDVPEPEEETGAGGVLIRSGFARRIASSYYIYAEPPDGAVGVSLREGDLAVADLLIGEEFDGEEMRGRVILTAVLEQEGDRPAFLGLAGRTGGLGDSIPRLRAALRLFGVENSTLEGFFPSPGPRIVGEEAFDLTADLVLAPEVLSGSVTLTDWTGQEETVAAGGSPGRPEVEISAGVSLFLRHYGGRAGKWIDRHVGSSGGRVVTTAVSTVAAAGEGVVHMCYSLGSGLFHFGKGLWQGDAAPAARGMAEAGTGVAEGAVKAVVGPGTALAEGTGFRRAFSGKGTVDRWRYETYSRWKAEWDRARGKVETDLIP